MENDDNKKQYTKFQYFLSAIFLVWFFGSIIAMLVCKKDSNMIIILFGQYFLVFGIITTALAIRDKKAVFPELIFTVIGFFCVFYGIANKTNNAFMLKLIKNHTIDAMLALSFITGLGLFIDAIFIQFIKKPRCSEAIDAKCVELKRKRIDKDPISEEYRYCPIYEIYYNGQKYRLCDNIYTKNPTSVNDSKMIRFNPDNPKEFYEPGKDKFAFFILLTFGILFMITSGLIFYIIKFVNVVKM